jgi:hypothetical protein
MFAVSLPLGLVLTLGFIAFCLVFLVGSIVLSIARMAWNACIPVQSAWARVVAKRTEVIGHRNGRTHTRYYGTFEFADATRREYLLSGTNFGLLVEGDAGRLSWQGTAYRGFERRIAGEKDPLESRAEL